MVGSMKAEEVCRHMRKILLGINPSRVDLLTDTFLHAHESQGRNTLQQFWEFRLPVASQTPRSTPIMSPEKV